MKKKNKKIKINVNELRRHIKNPLHLDNCLNKNGTGFHKDKKKNIWRKRKHKGGDIYGK